MKKLLVYLLIIATMLTSIPLVVLPASAEVDDSFYDDATPIETMEELAAMQEGGKYYLVRDITLTSAWVPVRKNNVTLVGTSPDGETHTITFNGGMGLFAHGDAIRNLTVKDLNLDGSMTVNDANTWHVSPIAMTWLKEKTTISNVNCDVDIVINGLYGWNEGAFNNQSVGGIAPHVESTGYHSVFEDIVYSGNITINGRVKYLGGMFGCIESVRNDSGSVTVRNCRNVGEYIKVYTKYEKTDGSNIDVYAGVDVIGGLIGASGSANFYMYDCKNSAAITFYKLESGWGPNTTSAVSPDFNYLGGLIGNLWADKVEMVRCENLPSATITAALTQNTAGQSGGLVGRIANIYGSGSKMSDCTNHANINLAWIEDNDMLGGIAGRAAAMTGGMLFERCKNYGNLHISENQGYLAGLIAVTDGDDSRSNNHITMQGCENYGNVTYDSDTGNAMNRPVGGIIGQIQAVGDSYADKTNGGVYEKDTHYVFNCINRGKIENTVHSNSTKVSVDAKHVGGIIGKVIATEHLDVRHCVNFGDIFIYDDKDFSYGWTEVGGVVGSIVTINGDKVNWHWSMVNKGDYYIIDCHNYGELRSLNVGGIFGATYQIYHDVHINIWGCTNNGTLSGQTKLQGGKANYGSVGGIVGAMDGSSSSFGILSIKECTNTGAVSGYGAVGGILAQRLKNESNNNPSATTIEECSNTGSVTCVNSNSTSGIAGGICAEPRGTGFTITNCSNTGAVTHSSGGAACSIGRSYATGSTFADGYTTYVTSGNYVNANSSAAEGTFITSTNSAADATALYKTNFKDSYKYSNLLDYGLSGYKKTTYATNIVHEHHLSAANKTDVELKLIRNITVEETASDLNRSLSGSTFDGNGYTVHFTNGGLFLFSWVKNSTIKNLTLTGNISSSGSGYVAPLSAQGSSYSLTLEDVTSSVNITVTPNGTLEVGGVIGKIITSDANGTGTATLKDVTYSGAIKSFADVATGASGGIVGNIGGISPTLQGDVTVTECSSTGTITSKGLSANDHSAAGGLFGSIEKNVTIKNCSYNGQISIEEVRICSGGIVGHIYALSSSDVITVKDCINYARITAGNAAGIIGGVCADFPAEAMSSATADLSCLNQYNGMKITVDSCQNAAGATIIGTRNASGILGDVTMIYSQMLNDTAANSGHLQPELLVKKCINSGAIEDINKVGGSNSYIAGIVACANRGVIEDCVNTGAIHGYQRSAGIIGSKHKPTNEWLTIQRCKNTGSVTGQLFSGGIMSQCWKGNVKFLSCVNSGAITTTNGSAGSQLFAAGIISYIGAPLVESSEEAWKAEMLNDDRTVIIDKCVNAGAVELSGAHTNATPRIGDGWKCTGGILATTRGDVNITNCVNLGRVTSGPDAPDNASYPIANGNEWLANSSCPFYQKPEVLITASNNYYLEGSAKIITIAGVTKKFQFSNMGDAATLESMVRAANVYVFDKTPVNASNSETIAYIARDIINNNYDGSLYTAEQKADLAAKYSVATAVYNNADVFAKQNEVYNAEDNLRKAVFAYTDKSSYIVYIPVANVASGSTHTIEFQPTDFSRFASAEVTLDSANDFKLIDAFGNELSYTLGNGEGGTYTDGGMIFNRVPTKNAANTVISKKIVVQVIEDDSQPAGTYRDTVSFYVTYNSGKPDEGN